MQKNRALRFGAYRYWYFDWPEVEVAGGNAECDYVAPHVALQYRSGKSAWYDAMVKIANIIVNEVSFGAYMTEEARQYLAEAQEELMLSNESINELRRVLIGST